MLLEGRLKGPFFSRMLPHGMVSNAVIRPHPHPLPLFKAVPAGKFQTSDPSLFIPLCGPREGWRLIPPRPHTQDKKPGCQWPCPGRMLRMALCSLFLIAGSKQLINCSALHPPAPAATAPWGHAGAQPLSADFGVIHKTISK